MPEKTVLVFYRCNAGRELRGLLGKDWPIRIADDIASLEELRSDEGKTVIIVEGAADEAFRKWSQQNSEFTVFALVPPKKNIPRHFADWIRLPAEARELSTRIGLCHQRWQERNHLIAETLRLRRDRKQQAQMTDGLLKLSLELKKAKDEVEKLSLTDSLTKLYNRRFFDMQMERDVLQSRRYLNPLSMYMMDIDNFKTVNDTYGHQRGDEVLIRLGKVIHRNLRETDWAARYGGEEFCVILPMTGASGAISSANRMHKAVENGVTVEKGIGITVSIGICTFNPDSMTRESMVGIADQGLYFCKKTGKNKVAFWDDNHHEFHDYTR